MRVIYLTGPVGSKKNGGSGLSGLRFLELLADRYEHVQVVTNAYRNMSADSVKCRLTKIKGYKPVFGRSLASIFRGLLIWMINIFRSRLAVIDAGQDDVLVVCNSFISFLDSVKIYNANSIQKICVVRGDTNSFDFQPLEQGDLNPLSLPLKFLKSFNHLIFVSKTTQHNWLSHLDYDLSHFLLPNAIDEDEVNFLLSQSVDDIRKELQWDDNCFHVVVVGSIQTRKGQDIFAKAAEKLFESIPSCIVHFVGTISRKWGGEEIAESLRTKGEGKFILYGHREDALSFVRAADVAVMVSHSEAFPRTVAEYMALGKAIISTSVAGADEMVVNGETGILIPIDDFTALTKALVAISSDVELKKNLGEAARIKYLSEYSMKSQEQKFTTIFDEIDKNENY